MKKIILLFLLFFSTAGLAVAQTNAGFVSGIWYSKLPFFAGETIRIYSAIQNQSGHDITGTVRFFDNGEVVGESGFSAVNGRLIESWIDWYVTEGEHKFQAKIFDAKKSTPGGGEESISLLIGSSEPDEKFADSDTDKDGVGNLADSDDDGDGISDFDEKKNGTDPLVFNKTEETKKPETEKLSEEKSESDSKLEQGKEVAEKFVVEPAKVATQKVLTESKPVINKIGELLQEKQEVVQKQIDEDRRQSQLAVAAASDLGFYERIREKLPPTFRILYNWLLKFLILIFSVWWIPLIILILILLRILLSVYRRVRR